MNRPVPADQALLRKLNTSAVMDCIRLCAPLSRAEMAAKTGLNRSTISSIVDELIDRGFVRETQRQDPTIGRPGMLLQLNPDCGCAIGIEIGVDFMSVVLTNFVAEILWRRHAPTLPGEAQIAIMERAEALINEALDYGASQSLRPLGIGVGVPGLVDERQGKLVFAPNLKWQDMPVRLILMRRFNLPVFVENEANCGALGEYFYGAAHGVKNYIYLNTGVGLGGGILIGGRLFKGVNGYGGEIGHITLYGDGEMCGCGRRGCWETYVSPMAICSRVRRQLQEGAQSVLAQMTQGDLEQLTLEQIIEAAKADDGVALEALHETGMHLAVGISNLINIFDPELVVLGGALSFCGRWLLPVIRQAILDVLPPLRGNVRVEASKQGWDSAVLGAIALVLDDIVREPFLNIER